MKSSPSDGYTLLVTDNSMFTLNPVLYAKLECDPNHDVVPHLSAWQGTNVPRRPPRVPASTLAEFIICVKANPGKVNVGSSGIGRTSEELGKVLPDETERFAKVIKAINIKAE